MSKETLREQALLYRSRNDFTSENPEDSIMLFMNNVRPIQGQVIAAYWPKEREFDVRYIIDHILKAGYACALPIVQKDSKILKFALWNSKTPLQKGPFGVMQPTVDEKTSYADPDILLIPFLAFDRKGYRLGYGGGYYDATLADLRKKKTITAVGVGYAQQACLFPLPTEPFDEKLDWVITPQQAFCFGEDG